MPANRAPHERFTSADVPSLERIGDPELRAGVVELFDRAREVIAEHAVDIAVLTARRLGCTYELCVREGMPELEGTQVVSDRWVEACPPSALTGRSILVMDDSIVAGTTLDRLHRQLRAAVGDNGSVRLLALCDDRTERLPYLLDGVDLDVLVSGCSSDRIRTFSRDLVKAFFAAQIPFTSDFPTTDQIQLGSGDLAKLLSADHWFAADVSHPLLADEGEQAAFSLIPSEERFDAFCSQLPPAVAALVDAYKIRLFVDSLDDGHRVVVMPIALLGPAHPKELERIAYDLRGALPTTDELRDSRMDPGQPESLHRLVQLFVTARTLADFWPAMVSVGVDELGQGLLDRLHVELYFGPSTDGVMAAFDDIVERDEWADVGSSEADEEPGRSRPRPRRSPLLDREQLRALLRDHRMILDDAGLPARPTVGSLTKVGLLFTAAIVQVFGFIEKRFERPQRAELRKLQTYEQYEDWREEHERLIDQGLTLTELRRELLPGTPHTDIWRRTLLTLGIDTGNDLGIVVPVTQHDSDRSVVYRTYRLGESAPLAEGAALRDESGDDLDEFVREALVARRPLRSRAISAKDAMRPEHPDSDPHALFDVIRDYQRAIAPYSGLAVYGYEGEVVEIDEETFRARLDGADGTSRTGEFPLKLIGDDQLDRLRVGAPLAWRVTRDDRDGSSVQTSVLHLFETPRIDVEALLADSRRTGLVSREDE